MTTLEDLLSTKVTSIDTEGNAIKHFADFRVAIQQETDKGLHVIVHAHGYSSDTLDLIIQGNTVVNYTNADCTEKEELPYLSCMKGQEYIDKTREYLDYLEEHLNNVRRAFIEITKACKDMWWVGDDATWHTVRSQVKMHDLSKFSKEEFVQYRQSFFSLDDEIVDRKDMQLGWEHHKDSNTHHHETAQDFIDVIHMVIDWTAMGYKFNDTAQKYYEANKKRIKLTDVQIELMYEIFEHMK